MKFSKCTGWVSAPNPLAEATERLRNEGREILNLTESNPTNAGFRYLTRELLNGLIHDKNLRYEPNAHGLPEAREAVCRYYEKKGTRLSPGQIILTASTSEAYSYVFRLLANAGECVLAPRPSYPLMDYLADVNDLRMIRYDLAFDNAWRIDFENLEEGFHENPKAVMVVHPNNPTGSYVQSPEAVLLNKMAARKDVAVISDEVFFDYEIAGNPAGIRSFAANREVLTFTLSGISKVLGLPQMKLSWIVVTGPENEKAEALRRLEIISDTYLSVSTPVQRALPVWFEHADRIRAEIKERIRHNWKYLRESAGRADAVKLCAPEGGWYCVCRLPWMRSDEEWALSLLESDQVLIHPAYLFDSTEESLAVVSLITPPEIFREGIARILRRVQQLS